MGTGQVGDSIRFALTYAAGNSEGPHTLVGKFPAADPTSRAASVAFGNYLREVNFYRELASSTTVSTPKVYLAEADPATEMIHPSETPRHGP